MLRVRFNGRVEVVLTFHFIYIPWRYTLSIYPLGPIISFGFTIWICIHFDGIYSRRKTIFIHFDETLGIGTLTSTESSFELALKLYFNKTCSQCSQNPDPTEQLVYGIYIGALGFVIWTQVLYKMICVVLVSIQKRRDVENHWQLFIRRMEC